VSVRRRPIEERVFDRSGTVPPPRWRDRIADTGAMLANIAGFVGPLPSPAELPRGDGHPVLVIPGLLSSDLLIQSFRDVLGAVGYDVEGWGSGINLGPTPACWKIVERRLVAMADRSGQSVSLVGHSLGGVMARALAQAHPELVRHVITVCSPFRLPTTMRLERLYRLLSYSRIDPEILLCRIAEPPPVPTTAIYSARDGIVAWQSCVDEPSANRENIAIDGAHSTMMSNPAAMRVIAERLARQTAAD
jgi:pimeloyl-ACP methyl ester carboxylesterase